MSLCAGVIAFFFWRFAVERGCSLFNMSKPLDSCRSRIVVTSSRPKGVLVTCDVFSTGTSSIQSRFLFSPCFDSNRSTGRRVTPQTSTTNQATSHLASQHGANPILHHKRQREKEI